LIVHLFDHQDKDVYQILLANRHAVFPVGSGRAFEFGRAKKSLDLLGIVGIDKYPPGLGPTLFNQKITVTCLNYHTKSPLDKSNRRLTLKNTQYWVFFLSAS
jgi:hypothetical protein